MTPARAARIRAQRVEGKQETNQEKREEEQKFRWTIEKLWERYKAQLPNGGTKTDISRWNLHLKKSFGEREPHQLVKLDVDRVRINLLKKRSPQTVKHVLALLRRIINHGADHGLITPLPFKITIPSVDNIKTEDLSPGQLQDLIAVLDTTHLTTAANMMRLVLFSGLRRGEIFKLKWSDIDFHRGFITIFEPKAARVRKCL